MAKDTLTAERTSALNVTEDSAHAELVRQERVAFDPRREPVWDQLNERQKALLKSKSPHISDAELAQAVEVAAAYQLDPYANEIWFSKSKPRDGRQGKLLIMTARDGLRKIAQRNGLELDCDVVRKNDVFTVRRNEQRERRITHEYTGSAEDRGPIVGAWAECWERRSNRQRGYFFAPLSEYDPGAVSYDSPWKKQKSVMILAATERQAVRQATPLGGLLVEGEDEVINAGAIEATSMEVVLPAAAERIIRRATKLGHAGLADRATIEMVLGGQGDDAVQKWCEDANAVLDGLEAQAKREPDIGPSVPPGTVIDEPADDPALATIDERIEWTEAALEDARTAGDAGLEQSLGAQLADLRAEADATVTDGQERLV